MTMPLLLMLLTDVDDAVSSHRRNLTAPSHTLILAAETEGDVNLCRHWTSSWCPW